MSQDVPIYKPGGAAATLACGVSYWTEIPREDIQVFARQLALLYSSGIEIRRSLEILHDGCQNPNLKEILTHVQLRVDSGHSLSVALRGFPKVFSPVFVGLVQVGEASGSLDAMLTRTADLIEKQNVLVRKLRAATIYPTFVASTSLVGMLLLCIFFLPMVEEMFDSLHVAMPVVTRWTLQAAKLVRNPAVIGSIIGLSAFLFWQLRPWVRRQQRLNEDLDIAIHQIPLSLPVIGGIVRQAAGARLLQTIATLLDVGLPLQNSLDLCIKIVDNSSLAEQLRQAKTMAKDGASLSDSLSKCQALPRAAINLIASGEEAASSLTEMLGLAARMQEEELDLLLHRIVMMVEPLVLVLVSIVVGFVLISTFLPLISILQSL